VTHKKQVEKGHELRWVCGNKNKINLMGKYRNCTTVGYQKEPHSFIVKFHSVGAKMSSEIN
jgi:hypothetical protein